MWWKEEDWGEEREGRRGVREREREDYGRGKRGAEKERKEETKKGRNTERTCKLTFIITKRK